MRIDSATLTDPRETSTLSAGPLVTTHSNIIGTNLRLSGGPCTSCPHTFLLDLFEERLVSWLRRIRRWFGPYNGWSNIAKRPNEPCRGSQGLERKVRRSGLIYADCCWLVVIADELDGGLFSSCHIYFMIDYGTFVIPSSTLDLIKFLAASSPMLRPFCS